MPTFRPAKPRNVFPSRRTVAITTPLAADKPTKAASLVFLLFRCKTMWSKSPDSIFIDSWVASKTSD
jgi:hypothetical protein